MTTIKATVHNGGLRLDEPLNLPEGCEVNVFVSPVVPGLSTLRGMTEVEQGSTPEEVARWIQLVESNSPPTMTDEEWEADQQRRREYREWQRANADAREQRLQSYLE